MSAHQAGILDDLPAVATYLLFDNVPGAPAGDALRSLGSMADGDGIVVGVGRSLVDKFGTAIDGLETFPALTGPDLDVPSTPAALWCWLRGGDDGDLVQRAREVQRAVSGAFRLRQAVKAFKHGDGRDLTGYEDGTENPEGEAAVAAAVVADGPLAGSSFVAVQQWVHDFDAFDAMSGGEQDHAIGRRRSDNEELDDAPASAHVKRTAQEDFDPEAFLLRRSMPWSDERGSGLMFVAFGRSFYAFDAQMRRMVGADDGITDALFRFTRPITGNYFWCPPVVDGHLDLRALGL